jgi:hypothetical protein
VFVLLFLFVAYFMDLTMTGTGIWCRLINYGIITSPILLENILVRRAFMSVKIALIPRRGRGCF